MIAFGYASIRARAARAARAERKSTGDFRVFACDFRIFAGASKVFTGGFREYSMVTLQYLLENQVQVKVLSVQVT